MNKKPYQLSDNELTQTLSTLASKERKLQAEFLYYLGEFDRRRYWANLGYSSLFSYLLEQLGFSKGAAYRRLKVVRLCRKHPEVLKFIACGDFSITTASIVARTCKNKNLSHSQSKVLIRESKGKSEDQLSYLTAKAIQKDQLESTRPVFVPMEHNMPPIPAPQLSLQPQSHSPLSDNSKNLDQPKNFPSPIQVKKMVEVKITLTQEEYAALKRMGDLTKENGPKAVIIKAVDRWLLKNDPLRKTARGKIENSVKFGSGAKPKKTCQGWYRYKTTTPFTICTDFNKSKDLASR